MRIATLNDLELQTAWFADPARPAADNAGPHVIVVDDFYDDPDAIRALGLAQEFVQYSPPRAEQVGAEVAGRDEFTGVAGTWRATALYRFRGRPVKRPVDGFRHNPEDVRRRMETLTGERVPADAWATGGDGWNGAFHLRDLAHTSVSIHHHYKDGDVVPRGWSGLVYLSRETPSNAGTSFWRDKDTGLCVAAKGATFTNDVSRFERVYEVENVYNRLVLFRENVLHRAENGFGADHEARLTQTFFFRSERA